MIKPFLYIIFLIAFASSAQNLVPNGSFEEYVNCPGFQNDPLAATFWYVPSVAGTNGGTSDVFNTCNQTLNPCSNLASSAPANCAGFQNPRTGEGYGGFISYYGFGDTSNYKEYLGIRLTESLLSGCEYNVTFYVSLADSCTFATNKIGAYFRSDSLPQFLYEPIYSNSKVEYTNGSVTNTDDWIEISGSFIADGSEQFLFIGSSGEYPDMMIDSVGGYPSIPSVMYLAYYYVDDVSVVNLCSGSQIDTTTSLSQNQVFANIFTPNNDGLNDILSYELSDQDVIFIINRWGEVVVTLNEGKTSWDGTYNGRLCVEGTYYYRAIFGKQVLTGFIELIR